MIETEDSLQGQERRGLFAREYARVYEKFIAIVTLRGFNRGEAEEIVQDAGYNALRAFDRFDTTRKFEPWFSTIVRNVCLGVRRRKSVEVVYTDDLEGIERMTYDNSNPYANPETIAAERQRDNQIRKAIDNLTPRQREIVKLHYFEDLSCREIADKCRMKTSAVKMRMSRAKDPLSLDLSAYATA